MTINRPYFAASLSAFPSWNCPHCEIGLLKELPKERQLVEPTYSKREHNEDWWEPEHIRQRFSAQLQCNNHRCGEIVFVVGESTTHYGGGDEEGEHWYETFEPRAAYPAVAVFRLKAEWPKSVTRELSLAFGHIFGDAGAAANRLRTAVECLLDHLGVKKATLVANGTKKKKVKLNLHRRIEAFKLKNPEAAGLLLAVKWLGNAGSHADLKGVTRDDVLDGMDMMQLALHLLFDKSSAAVQKLAKSINKKKGPVKKVKAKK
jgi:hypothetical protein